MFLSLPQGVMESKPYPWFAGLTCALLVLSSVLFMPGVAILRKLGVLTYSRAKAAAADTHGHTVSTARFLGSNLSTRSEDRDSGLNSDPDDNHKPGPEPEQPVTFTIDDFRATGGGGGGGGTGDGRAAGAGAGAGANTNTNTNTNTNDSVV